MHLALSHHLWPVDPLPSRTSTVLVGAVEAVGSFTVSFGFSKDSSLLSIDVRDAMIAA